MKNKVLLNWLPPSLNNSPSPSMSVLKDYLDRHGYDVTVVYWNVLLENCIKSFMDITFDTLTQDINKLLPFFVSLSHKRDDKETLDRIIYYLIAENPNLHRLGYAEIRKRLLKSLNEFTETVKRIINSLPIESYLFLGFSVQFGQWIAADMIIDIIKSKNFKTKIVAGGFGTKDEANAFMESFNSYDYALWGEGEISLLSLCRYLSDDHNELVSAIPNLVYRTENNELKTSLGKVKFVNLDESQHDVSEYFTLIDSGSYSIKHSEAIISIEGGRGCHWERCRFCFLNSGYRFRVKSIEKIIEEIRYFIKTYDIRKFAFLDNDLIGNSPSRFDRLLDMLIQLHNEESIEIEMAEIITKGINYDTILKMSLAGFKSIQIGYESPSDNLLKKINKKNTFASNLILTKWATILDVKVGGLNVICNLLEEEDGDISESIKNLNYLRFYFKGGLVKHNMSRLAISKASRYFKEAHKSGLINQLKSTVYSFLPSNYIKDENVVRLFFDCVLMNRNKKWDVFEKIESHFLVNLYTYKLLSNRNSIFYHEYYNDVMIKEIEFSRDECYWDILCFCNRECRSLQSIQELFYVDDDIVSERILELKSEGLLYTNDNMEEIVTVIDTDRVYQ